MSGAPLKLPVLIGPKDKVVVEVSEPDGSIEKVAIKESNDLIQLAIVNFNLASFGLTPAAKAILNKLIAVIKQHGFTSVDLIGYTDALDVH